MSSRGGEDQQYIRVEEGSPCGIQEIPDSPSVREHRKSIFMTPQKEKRKVPLLDLGLIYESYDDSPR